MTTPALTQTPASDDDYTLPIVIYILYLIGAFMPFVPSLIGVIIAHVKAGSSTGAIASHYRYQIRTFWWSVLIPIVGGVLSLVMFGSTILSIVWAIVTAPNFATSMAAAGSLIGTALVTGIALVAAFFFVLIRSVMGVVKASQREAI